MRPPKRGNDCQRWADRIQEQRFLLSEDPVPEEPWPSQDVIERPCGGFCTIWDLIWDRYRASQGRMADKMRATIAALMLMAGGDRERIRGGRM